MMVVEFRHADRVSGELLGQAPVLVTVDSGSDVSNLLRVHAAHLRVVLSGLDPGDVGGPGGNQDSLLRQGVT